jgi:hypothetical protein
MVSQNRQNFQNRLLSIESRQPAPFQRILKDARKSLRVFMRRKARWQWHPGWVTLPVSIQLGKKVLLVL